MLLNVYRTNKWGMEGARAALYPHPPPPAEVSEIVSLNKKSDPPLLVIDKMIDW